MPSNNFNIIVYISLFFPRGEENQVSYPYRIILGHYAKSKNAHILKNIKPRENPRLSMASTEVIVKRQLKLIV